MVFRIAVLSCLVIASLSAGGKNESGFEVTLSEPRELTAAAQTPFFGFETKNARISVTGDSIMEGASAFVAIADIVQGGPSMGTIGAALSQTSKFIGFALPPPAGWALGLFLGVVGGMMVNQHNADQPQPPTIADVMIAIQQGFQQLAGKLDDLSTQVGYLIEVVKRIEGLLKDYTVFHMKAMYDIQFKYEICLQRFADASEPNSTWKFKYFRQCVSNAKQQLELMEQAVQPSNLRALLLDRLKGRKTFCDAADVYKLVVSTRVQLCQLYVWQAGFADESLRQLINRDVETAITDMTRDMEGYQEVLKTLGGDGWAGRQLQLAIESTAQECRQRCYGLSCGQQGSGYPYDNCECRCLSGWTHSREFDSDSPSIVDGLLYRDCDVRAASCGSHIDLSMKVYLEKAHASHYAQVGRHAHKNFFFWFTGEHTLTRKAQDMTSVKFRLKRVHASTFVIQSLPNTGNGEEVSPWYYLRGGSAGVDFGKLHMASGDPGNEGRWILEPISRRDVYIKNVANNKYLYFADYRSFQGSLTATKGRGYSNFRFEGCYPEYKADLSGGQFVQPAGVPEDPEVPDWAANATSRATTTTTTATTTTTTATTTESSAFSKSTDSTCTGSKADLLRAFPGSEASCKAKCLQLNCQGFLRVRTGIFAGKCFFRGGQVSSPVAYAGRDCFTREATITTTTTMEPEPQPMVFSKSTDSTCSGSKSDLLRGFPGSEALCKAKCLQLNCQAFLRVRTGVFAGKCFIRGGQASSPVAFAGRDCFTREVYTKHGDKQCVGSLPDLQRDFAGSEKSCKAKCSELGCGGFIRVRSGLLAGKCFFRGGSISAPVQLAGRDCFTRAVRTVPYTAHPESQCLGSKGDLQRLFAGSEESCKRRCDELACNGFIRVTGGTHAGKCFFRGGTISQPIAYPGRTCFTLGGAKPATV